jgi:putative nucleotidyltransferase with HDIG domain
VSELITWAQNTASEQLSRALPRRWTHVQGVARRAGKAAALHTSEDSALLVAAAALHDIGYAPDLAYTGFHPLDGARYLRGLGVPQRLSGLVARHSCAYREAELRGLSAELTEWVDEETPLRDALWWADMTTSPDGEVVSFEWRIAEIQERYGPEDLVRSFIRQAEPELRGAVERTEERLRAAGIAF